MDKQVENIMPPSDYRMGDRGIKNKCTVVLQTSGSLTKDIAAL